MVKTMANSEPRTILMLGIGSDIGQSLALKYLELGHQVIGTYRKAESVAELRNAPGATLIRCDVSNPPSIESAVNTFKALKRPWDVFISAVGSLEPIGSFFELDYHLWHQALETNALGPLRLLHGIYPYRRQAGPPVSAVFFAGGGTNSPFPNYSSYCISKIILMKMCELLDSEYSDLNPFILGPGWVRTKIHEETLRAEDQAGSNLGRTQEFMDSGNLGTPMSDIYDCIEWCLNQGKPRAGGRNFSIVHDPWGSPELAEKLAISPDLYKLRRNQEELNP